MLLINYENEYPPSVCNYLIQQLQCSEYKLLTDTPLWTSEYIKDAMYETAKQAETIALKDVPKNAVSIRTLDKNFDRLMEAKGIRLIEPLEFVTPEPVVQWFKERLIEFKNKKRKRLLLGEFMEMQIEHLKLPAKLAQSTDSDNRSAIPKSLKVITKSTIHPINRKEALKQLEEFIEAGYPKFAEYEDAVIPSEPQLYHSGLSMALNIGLIFPEEVLKKVLAFRYSNNEEAYVRELLGWREYSRLYAEYALDSQVKLKNPLGLKSERELSRIWWPNKQSNSILEQYPIIHDILQQIWKYAYTHHINRLYLLSFMIELGVRPESIYEWFLTMFADANPWVMEFNVYAMGHFDDRFTRKPYIFSSNYYCQQSGGRFNRDESLDALYALNIANARVKLYHEQTSKPTPSELLLAEELIRTFTQS